MYAIIKTGGKQVQVSVNDSIFVEKLNNEVNSEVIFDQVLFINDEKKSHIGKPTLEAQVKGIVEKQGKRKKLTIFRTKEKSNWQKKNGHRQQYTRVQIKEIILKGKTLAK